MNYNGKKEINTVKPLLEQGFSHLIYDSQKKKRQAKKDFFAKEITKEGRRLNYLRQ